MSEHLPLSSLERGYFEQETGKSLLQGISIAPKGSYVSVGPMSRANGDKLKGSLLIFPFKREGRKQTYISLAQASGWM